MLEQRRNEPTQYLIEFHCIFGEDAKERERDREREGVDRKRGARERERTPLEKQYRYTSSHESRVSHWPNTLRCYRRFPGESIVLQKLALAL